MKAVLVAILATSVFPINISFSNADEGNSFLNLMRRSERLLQGGSFGGYNIEYPSSELDCDSGRSQMDYTQEDLDDRNYYTTRMFKFGRGASLDWLKSLTEDDKSSMKTVVCWVVIPVVIVGILFGILIGLFALVDIILRLIGKEGLIFKGGDGEGIKTESLRKMVFMILGALTVIIIVLMFFWLTYSVRTKSSYNHAQCANRYLEEDLIYGINDEYMTFPGARGYRYLLGNLKEEIKLVDNSPSVNPILIKDLDNQVDTMKNTLTNFFNTFGSRTITSCSGNDRLVRPDSTRNLEPYINEDISKESEILMQIASDIHIGAGTIDYLQNRGCLKKYTLSLDMMLGKMSEFERSIENSKTRLALITDYPYSRSKMIWFAWLCFIFLTLGLIFAMFILFTNVFQGNNREIARLCQGIGAILIFVLGVWYSILAVRAAYRAHRQNQTCYYAHKATTEREYTTLFVDGD
jgi:hypothetical protein